MNQTWIGSELGRIARGNLATIGEFPYMARMDVDCNDYIRQCGAVLIGINWLLTAAHCFRNAIAVEVYLGTILIDDAKVSYQIPLTDVKIYPSFNLQHLTNDIALVKIPSTDLCNSINIVPLPKLAYHYRNYENEVGIGSGWGIINDQHVLSDKLLWGRMKILREEECDFININENEMCVTNSSEWALPCKGDSGGPLVSERSGELIGIMSNGDSRSCEYGDPAIFTRVTSYLDWIKEISGIFY